MPPLGFGGGFPGGGGIPGFGGGFPGGGGIPGFGGGFPGGGGIPGFGGGMPQILQPNPFNPFGFSIGPNFATASATGNMTNVIIASTGLPTPNINFQGGDFIFPPVLMPGFDFPGPFTQAPAFPPIAGGFGGGFGFGGGTNFFF